MFLTELYTQIVQLMATQLALGSRHGQARSTRLYGAGKMQYANKFDEEYQKILKQACLIFFFQFTHSLS